MLEKIIKLFNFQKNTETNETILNNIDDLFNSMNSDIITIFVGSDFTKLVDTITNTIKTTRMKVKEDTGFIIPEIHILNDDNLQENELNLHIRGKKVLQRFVVPNIKEIEKELQEILNIIYQEHLEEIFSLELVEKYIEFSREKLAWTIWNITNMYSISEIRNILIYILKNQKSIRDINYVFEKFAICCSDFNSVYRQNPDIIAQRVASEL